MKTTEFCRAFALGLLLLVLVSNTQGHRIRRNLRCQATDIVLILDSSSSIWQPYFENQLKFAKSMIDHLDIGLGSDQIRVGVEAFNTITYNHLFLSDSTDKNVLKMEINKIQYKNGSTNIGAALRLLLSTMFTQRYGARDHVKHVAIILTDGQSQDPKATKKAAEDCRKADIQVIAIGIGNYADPSKLLEIARDPKSMYYKNSSSLVTLERFRDDILRQICPKVTIIRTNPTTRRPDTTIIRTNPTTQRPDICQTNKRTDVVFMVSNSHFGKVKTDHILTGTAEVIKSVSPSRNFQFGYIFDDCLPTQDVPLGLIAEESKIINFKTGSIGALIHKLRTKTFKHVTGRVRQVGLLFLDHTINLTDPQIIHEARHATFKGIELYAVMIGEGVNEELVEKYITTKDRIIKIYWNYYFKSELPSKFFNIFCRASKSTYKVDIF